LKEPLGELWIGDVAYNINRLKRYIKKNTPTSLATVGDFVSYHILEAGINPDIIVFDHRIMRESVDLIEFDRKHVKVTNAPGSITIESQSVLYQAVQENEHLAIIVEGEEDLLVLPLMAYMPLGSVIIYGQPREGMVVITLNEERRSWATRFMKNMSKKRDKCDNP